MSVYNVTCPIHVLVAADNEEDARKKAMAHIDWEMDENWLEAEDTGESDDGGDDIIR